MKIRVEKLERKVFAAVLLIALVCSLVGATVLAAAPKTGKISIWAWDPKFNIAIMKEAKERYLKLNPKVEIEIVEMAKKDLQQKLHTVLASGIREGLPNIVLIEDYNAQKYLQAYPGAFVDLTRKIDYKQFAPYKVELMTLKGKKYGVPFDSGAGALFYRTDYLAMAGLKPSDLMNITWDQYIEINKKVKAATGKDAFAFNLAADGGLMRMMLQSAGQWYFDKNGKVNIAKNEALKEAYFTYKKLVDGGFVRMTNDWTEWVGTFNKGETASIITGCWIIGSIKAEKSQAGKWGVFPTPRLNHKQSVNYTNNGGSSWYITQASANRAVAEDFLKTIFAADHDFYQKILVNQGAIGTFLPSQDGPAYLAGDEFFGGQKVFADFSDWMKKIPGVDYGIYTYEADAALMGSMPNFLAGKISVEEVLKKAEAQVKSQLNL